VKTLAQRVVALLNGRTIATAESCTAGRIAQMLACVEKATEFFRGGVVAYQESIKRDLLGVRAKSVLSLESADQMAVGIARLLHADVAISTTGVAGHKAEDGTPPGTVYIGTKVGETVTSNRYRFDGTPDEVCDQARRQALLALIKAMS
jgi:nicotinamide-nucleotide amidase